MHPILRKDKPIRLLAISTILLGIGACATTKYVDEGQALLSRVDIELDSTARADALRRVELMPYISQKPNRKVFGTLNWPLGIYNLSKRGSNAWLSRRLRAWGEPPVIYNEQEAEYSQRTLASALYNMGYLDAEVTRHIDTLGTKRIALSYRLKLGELYRIAQHQERIADSEISALLHPSDTLRAKRNFPNEQYRSLLAPPSPLSPNLMQRERKRISQIVRNRGYWDFREDMIHFDVDTTAGHSSAWVRTVIDSLGRTYHIGQVSLEHLSPEAKPLKMKSKQLGGIHYNISGAYPLRAKFLDSRLWLRPGELFSQDLAARTYASLSDIPAIRSAVISYQRDTTALSPVIDVHITTQAERSKELSTELVGTHTGGNLGAMASATFRHNNIFNGAEQLRLSGNIGYEELRAAQSDHLSYGFEAALAFPRLIMPLGSRLQRNMQGATDISLSYNYLTRPEFSRNIFSAAWAYNWRPYRHPAWSYTFKFLEVDYMHFGYMDERFLSTVPDYDRMLNYRNQLVLSSSLALSYNSSKDYRWNTSPYLHSFRLYLQSAGNLLMAYSRLLGGGQDKHGAYTSLGGAHIVQFFRGEVDYSGMYRLGGKNALAYHFGLSTVVPYGNSDFLPIDLRYFSGGASSLRAWSARGLGPGSMPRSVGTSIFHQVGDIKLDLSLELRLRVAPSWELALFSDAGNIWTIRRYAEQPGGNFDFSRFYREVAWSSGLGLRWDFDYFLLRLDAGLKLYDPQEERGKRWVIGRKGLNDLVGVHFALGYPF